MSYQKVSLIYLTLVCFCTAARGRGVTENYRSNFYDEPSKRSDQKLGLDIEDPAADLRSVEEEIDDKFFDASKLLAILYADEPGIGRNFAEDEDPLIATLHREEGELSKEAANSTETAAEIREFRHPSDEQTRSRTIRRKNTQITGDTIHLVPKYIRTRVRESPAARVSVGAYRICDSGTVPDTENRCRINAPIKRR